MNWTEATLRKRIEFWRDRMVPLGVGHWRIQDITIGPNVPGSDNGAAAVWSSGSYDTCEFYFRDGYLADASEQDVDETIIHEWLHVAWRDLDKALGEAHTWFPSGAWDDYYARIDHEREGVIDRTSRAIYERHIALT